MSTCCAADEWGNMWRWLAGKDLVFALVCYTQLSMCYLFLSFFPFSLSFQPSLSPESAGPLIVQASAVKHC